MKNLAWYSSLFAIFSIFLLSHSAYADSSTNVNISNNGSNSQSSVNVQNNTGGNTICQNGNCTTTSGNGGQSTVCINGQCETSSGNINMQSNNGDDQVHISNNATISTTPAPTTYTISVTPILSPAISISPIPTSNLSPTITQLHRVIHKQIKKQIQDLKEHIKNQDVVITSLMQSLQQFLNGLFK